MDNVRLESQSDEHPEYKHTQHPEQKILTEPDLQFRENVWEIGKQKVNGFPPNRKKHYFSRFSVDAGLGSFQFCNGGFYEANKHTYAGYSHLGQVQCDAASGGDYCRWTGTTVY